ncbi:serine/threonine-protein kinase [Kiritimatiellaeota bacterium B1221]|nr:serine/threonine-protein kinase [Kiritimatiellaeota bacterium B1221]
MNQNANSLGIFTESIARVACPSCNAELDVSDFQVFEEIVCPSCEEKFQVPGRLGDFILIEELGRGAMGCVYLAMDESLKRLVALKVIRKEYGADPKMLETVQREAQAMATLNHRNIVQVYTFGRVKEQPYFVMELLEGERLDEMMANGNKIPEIRALEIALDVAQGLNAADQAGLTHGDIKPANILMNEHGVAKVVDFGLAKFMEPGAEIEVWGTPYYIAPEKARKKGEDSRSDQYSLGGTIFHSLAGQPPFDGPNPTKVVVAALKEDTPDLRDFNEGVTEKTAAVIRRMMEKNPNRRYPTYASLLADLNLALKAAKEAEEARIQEEKRQLSKQNKKMNPLIPIALSVTLIVCGGIGFVAWKQMNANVAPPVAKYEGPPRELLKPFTKAEVRNLREAAESVKDKDLTTALEKLDIAKLHVPENHVAMSWLKFLEAGIFFYAQYPDRAKALLEESADMEEVIFDADRTPDEDPRILSSYALGNLELKDLEKATRKSEPYYRHLAELAKGYRFLLEGEANQSARHFRFYSEQQGGVIQWPYVLQPLAPLLHVPLEKLISEEEQQEVLEAQASQLMSGLGIRTNKGYPLFKTAQVRSDGIAKIESPSSPSWKELGDLAYATVSSGHALVNAGGLQVLPNRSFTVSAQISTPAVAERKTGKSDVLFHFGGFLDKDAPAPSASVPVKGLVVEIPPVVTETASVRIRMGDGEKDLLVQSLPHNSIKLGSRQVFSVSWEGYRADGATPSYKLVLAVDGKTIGSVDLEEGPFPDRPDFTMVTVGKGIGRGEKVGWGGEKLSVSKIVVYSESLTSDTLYANIQKVFF